MLPKHLKDQAEVMPKLPDGQIDAGTLNVGGEALQVGSYGVIRGYSANEFQEIRIDASSIDYIADSLGRLASNNHALFLHKALKSTIKAGHKPQAEGRTSDGMSNYTVGFKKLGPLVIGVRTQKFNAISEPVLNFPKIFSVGTLGLKSAAGIKKS